MLKEFKSFAVRGNIMDLAIGIIIGIAFGTVVSSLVDDVIMSLIGAIFGKPDFSDLTFAVGDGVIRYGAFLTALVNFVIVALVLFFVVKGINKMKGASPEPPSMRECPFCMTSVPVTATRCSACTSELRATA